MVISDIKNVDPSKDMVIIKLVNLDANMTMQSDEDSVAVRYGEVISKGPEVDLPIHCSGLEIGEIAVVTEFAGYHLATNDGTLCKTVRGYDIIGKCKTMEDIENSIVTPAADRVLVEELDINEGSDLILGSNNDPRLTALNYGIIKLIGPDLKDKTLVPGLIVAYPPYAGTTIREYESETNKALKMLVEIDVLLKVRQ